MTDVKPKREPFIIDGIVYDFYQAAQHLHVRQMIEVRDLCDAGEEVAMLLSMMDDPICDKCWMQGRTVLHPDSCEGNYHYRDIAGE